MSTTASLPDPAANLRPDRRAAPAALSGLVIPHVLLAGLADERRAEAHRCLADHFVVNAADEAGLVLDALRSNRFDVVVCDAGIPGGAAALSARIRSEPGIRAAPFILLLSEEDAPGPVDGSRAGIDDLVYWPFRSGELIARIKVQLELARAREQAVEVTRTLRSELERQAASTRRLHEVTLKVARESESETALRTLLAGVMEAGDSDRGLISLCSPEGKFLHVAATAGFEPEFVASIQTMPVALGPCGVALARRERVIIEDVTVDPEFVEFRPWAQAGGFRSSHSVPLITRHGRIIGVLTTHHAHWHRPDQNEIQLMDLYGQMASDLLEHLRDFEGVRASERHLAEILAAMPAGVYTCDAEGRVNFHNQAAAQLWGGAPDGPHEQWCGAQKLFHPDGTEMPFSHSPMARALAEGRSIRDVEMVIQRVDGSRRHVLPHVEPIRGERQTVAGAVVLLLDISDRKIAEAALRNSEDRMGRLLALMPAGVYACDAEGRITFFNRRAVELWGREPRLNDRRECFCAALRAYAPDGTFISPECTPMAQALRHGQSFRDVEAMIQRPDGSRITVNLNIDAMRDANGRVTGAINVFQDVTQRKQAEMELRDSEQRLRLATDVGRVGVWDWDMVKGQVLWTDSMYAMHGVKRGEFEPDLASFESLVLPEDLPAARAILQGALDRNEPYELEFRAVRPDGSVCWLFSNAVVLRENDRPVRMLGATVDISERKCIEIALRASEREAAERFRFMANTAPALVWQADTTTRCVWFNERWLSFVGHALEEEVGSRWDKSVHPDDREHCARIYEQAFAAREEFEMDYRLRRKDGVYRWILDRGVPLYESDGSFTGYIGSCIDITERKKAEESVQRLAAIVESSDDAIIGKDLRGRITSWNKGAEHVFGYTAEEAIGQSIALLIPEERRGEELKIIESISSGTPLHHYETIRRRRDGVLIDVSLTVSPIFDAEGRMIGISKIARDVTQRKRHEAELRRQELALRESEGRFRILADNIAQLAWMADVTGACFWFNQRWLDYSGMTPEQAIGWGWQKAHHPDHAERVIRRYHQQIAAGQVWEDTYLLRAKDESYRWFLTRATPIRDETGQILRWLGTNTDITNWKNAQEALRASERQLRLVTDNAPVYLMQIDRQHRFKFANLTYARRFGREVHDVIGAPLASIVGDAAYAALRGHIETTLQGERVEFEVEIPYEGLGPRWMHVVFVPERNGDGEVVGLVAVLSDVTERRNAEREMEIARDRALEASRAKDDFLAALSHELRTPLNPVLLLASEAAEDTELPERVRADFATIRKNVELEARLIDDLLDLTRITRGKLPLDLRPHDIHAILQDAVATVRAEMEQKGIVLRFELGARRSVVRGDAVRLQQLLWNLLKNAVKFTPDSGRITIRTFASAPDRVTVAIKDTGIGLTPAEISRIFDAFSQGDHAGGSGSHRFGGVGLGLAISRTLAEIHAGTLSVHSDGRDQGATFTVDLPYAGEGIEIAPATSAPRTPEIPAAGSASVDSPAPTRGRILLVDDHEPTRAALAHLLTRRRYEVVTAGSAAEALALAESVAIDFVVSDIGLPDATGYELMEQLRNNYGLHGVALSGYGMEHDISRSQSAGFAAHLTKPVRIQSLDQALGLLVGKSPRS